MSGQPLEKVDLAKKKKKKGVRAAPQSHVAVTKGHHAFYRQFKPIRGQSQREICISLVTIRENLRDVPRLQLLPLQLMPYSGAGLKFYRPPVKSYKFEAL